MRRVEDSEGDLYLPFQVLERILQGTSAINEFTHVYTVFFIYFGKKENNVHSARPFSREEAAKRLRSRKRLSRLQSLD